MNWTQLERLGVAHGFSPTVQRKPTSSGRVRAYVHLNRRTANGRQASIYLCSLDRLPDLDAAAVLVVAERLTARAGQRAHLQLEPLPDGALALKRGGVRLVLTASEQAHLLAFLHQPAAPDTRKDDL